MNFKPPCKVSDMGGMIAIEDARFVVIAETTCIDNARDICTSINFNTAMYDLIGEFGTAVTNMFEQMEKGNWVDAEGHNVKMNAAMRACMTPVVDAIKLRAAIQAATS